MIVKERECGTRIGSGSAQGFVSRHAHSRLRSCWSRSAPQDFFITVPRFFIDLFFLEPLWIVGAGHSPNIGTCLTSSAPLLCRLVAPITASTVSDSSAVRGTNRR